MSAKAEHIFYQIVDEILAEMPLEEKVSLAKMDEEDVDVLQGVFTLYLQSTVDPEDEDYENITHELWERLKKTHRLRIVK